MARIVISTIGTIGDVVPFITLGKALRERNHQVVLAVQSAHHALVHHAGLEAVPCGPPFGPEQARQAPDITENFAVATEEVKRWEALLSNVPAKYTDLHDCCRGADLLIAHSFHYAALLVHNQLGVPWVCVALIPGQFRHYEHQANSQPAPRADLNLLASSLAFSQIDLDLYAHVAITGFWFYDAQDQPDWQPTPAQRAFVEEGERPLVLTLGSLPGSSAAEIVARVVAGTALLKRKLVVQAGFTDLPAAIIQPDHVLHVHYLPHDWLFPRADAVLHHGSIGVTARALRHGCPMLLMPHRKDQYFHTMLCKKLGAGYGMLPAKLTPEGIARMLSERVLTDATRTAAAACREKLAAEDGISTACGLIEDKLRGKHLLVG